MKDTPFILGFERIASGKTTQQKSLLDQDDDDEDDSLLQYRLGLASEVVIIDDTTTLNDFRDHILSCPQDDLIEAFVEVSEHLVMCCICSDDGRLTHGFHLDSNWAASG